MNDLQCVNERGRKTGIGENRGLVGSREVTGKPTGGRGTHKVVRDQREVPRFSWAAEIRSRQRTMYCAVTWLGTQSPAAPRYRGRHFTPPQVRSPISGTSYWPRGTPGVHTYIAMLQRRRGLAVAGRWNAPRNCGAVRTSLSCAHSPPPALPSFVSKFYLRARRRRALRCLFSRLQPKQLLQKRQWRIPGKRQQRNVAILDGQRALSIGEPLAGKGGRWYGSTEYIHRTG